MKKEIEIEKEVEKDMKKIRYLQPEGWFVEEKEKEIVENKRDSLGFAVNPMKRQKEYIEEGVVSEKGIYQVKLLVKVCPPDTIPYSVYELKEELEQGYLKRIERIYAQVLPAKKWEIERFEYLEEEY